MPSPKSRGEMMLNDPLNRVIPRLAVPTIISMLVTAIYNMADTFFVGQIGTAASGAVGVIFPMMAMIQAISFTIGIGSGANMSRSLGAGQPEKARTYVSVAFFTAFMTGLLVGVACLFNLDTLVRFLGATETIAPYARDYAFYILLATPFMMSSFVMNNLLRFQGMATYAMVGITTGGILNMLLDPLLIHVMGLGCAGAAIATGISQFVSFTILLLMSNRNPNTISIQPRFFKPTLKLYGNILYNGVPSLGRQGIASVSTIILNNAAATWGDPAIAAMSIVNRYILFINSAVVGFGQGFQPLCSFCYGAGRYSRVRNAYAYCIRVSTIILLVLAIVSALLSGGIIQVFRDDPQVIEIGTLALRLQLLTVPLWGLITMSNMFTQSIGYGIRATLIAVSRQGLFLIPALLILPPTLGLLGLQISQPAADACSFVLALLVCRRITRQMAEMPDKE